LSKKLSFKEGPHMDRMDRTNSAPMAESTVTRIVSELSNQERRTYSYARLLQHLAKGGPRRNPERTLEIEVSETLERSLGQTPEIGSVWIPLSLSTPQEKAEQRDRMRQRAGLDTLSGLHGGFLASTGVSPDVISLLRQKAMLAKLGAQIVSLDRGVALPVQTANSSSTWVSENPQADTAESDSAFGQRVLFPHEMLTTTSFSLRLLMQSSVVIEAFVRSDISAAVASGLDQAGISGSGLQSQPLGLLGTFGVGSVIAGTDGGTPTHADMVDFEAAVASANADSGNLAFLTTPGVRKLLRNTQEFSGSSFPIWQAAPWSPGAGMILNYRAEVSTAVPSNLSKGNSTGVCNAILFGDWSQLILAEFGSAAVLVDPYKLKRTGQVEVSCYLSCDCLARRPESFAIMTDALVA
jgi:HK97 family phage major capsid protein